MEKIIAVKRNRDGATIWFEHLEGDIYTIKASKQYVLEYACVNYEPLPDDAEDFDEEFKKPDGTIQKAHLISFDPSGGPYITMGEVYEGYEVQRIFFIEGTGTCFKLVKKTE